MKRLLVLAMMALSVPAVSAGTATFGLFPGCGLCGLCGGGCGCPGPYNAFSPTDCCCVANAAGCTLYPGGYHGDPYIAGGQRIGGGGCGPHGCGHRQWFGFHKHGCHAEGFAYDLPLPYPCGAQMAFTGTPGGLGCGDPYNGCGSAVKDHHPLLSRLAAGLHHHHHGASSAPPEHLCDYFKGGWGKFGWGHKGGCATCDGEVASSDLVVPTEGHAVPTPAPATIPHSVAAPVYQPVSYQPVSYQPVSYQPAYYPQAAYYGYYPAWGYYPAYGY